MTARRWGVVAALLLGGCNLAPAYQVPAVPAPAQWRPIPGWSDAAPAETAARGRWWQRFGDPVLNGLEQRLDADNPDLAAAVARHDAALGYAMQAHAAQRPALGLEGSAIQNRQSDDRPLRGTGQPDLYGADQADVVAGYDLDLWGKARNLARSAGAEAEASDADRAAIQLSLEAQLADAYVALRGQQAQAALLEQTVAAYQRSYDLTRTLYRGKLAAQMDVSRAATQLETARTAAADIDASRAALGDAVAVLTGQAPSTFTIAPGGAIAVPDVPERLPGALLQRRPDVAAAERRVAAANARIGSARAAFYPDISFTAQGGVMSQGVNPFTVGDLFWALGPSVTLPLFEGGRLHGQLAEARADWRAAAAGYRAATLRAFREVEDNRALLAALMREAASSTAAVTAAQQTADAALALYRNGATSYLDVVTAQTSLLQARQAALTIATRRQTATVDLIHALGGDWPGAAGRHPAQD